MAEGKAGMSGWRIALNIVGATILVVFGSCAFFVYMAGQKKSDDAARGTAHSAESPHAPPPLVPEPPAGFSGTVSVATFTKGTRLDECDDFTITLPPETDGGQEILSKTLDAMSKDLATLVVRGGGGKKSSKIGKPCAEQFRTTPVLATCVAQLKGDAGGELDVAVRYYNLDTITSSDTYMKNCLDMHGDWQAADKDSDEYREAVHARARREAEGIVKNAQKTQESLAQ